MRVARLKRFLARPTFEDELELHRVDCLASHGSWTTTNSSGVAAKSLPTNPSFLRPFSPVTTSSHRVETGTKVQAVLDAVQIRQLEGILRTRDEALDWVAREYCGRLHLRLESEPAQRVSRGSFRVARPPMVASANSSFNLEMVPDKRLPLERWFACYLY